MRFFVAGKKEKSSNLRRKSGLKRPGLGEKVTKT